MWLYLQVKRRVTGSKVSSIEATEHTIRIDDGVINKEALYGRCIYFDSVKYEFDRFALNGEPTFVRNETPT